MFEVGFFEILVIATLALIVLGPEKLPRVARQVGRWMGRARSMARQFREQLEEEVDLAETTKTKESTNSRSASAGAAGATAAGTGAASEGSTAPENTSHATDHFTAEGETYTPYSNVPETPPPPEVAAAHAAAAETEHSENPNAPAPEPEASMYEPPAYANGSTHESLPDEESSAARSSKVESPPSQLDDNPDEEAPRKAGDYITTTHERSI